MSSSASDVAGWALSTACAGDPVGCRPREALGAGPSFGTTESSIVTFDRLDAGTQAGLSGRLRKPTPIKAFALPVRCSKSRAVRESLRKEWQRLRVSPARAAHPPRTHMQGRQTFQTTSKGSTKGRDGPASWIVLAKGQAKSSPHSSGNRQRLYSYHDCHVAALLWLRDKLCRGAIAGVRPWHWPFA